MSFQSLKETNTSNNYLTMLGSLLGLFQNMDFEIIIQSLSVNIVCLFKSILVVQ
jgi:hypothetical protein